MSVCQMSDGLTPYAAAQASLDSLTDSIHCDSLKDVLNGLISIPSSRSGMLPAFDPPAPHASLKASINLLRCSSFHGWTFAGRRSCALSLPEELHNCLLNLPACICSSRVCLSALIGEIYPPGFPGLYVLNCTKSAQGISTGCPPFLVTTVIDSAW